MTGTPTEAEIRTQWRNAVDVLETVRNFADGTMATSSGPLTTLLQSLKGEYTPVELANFAQTVRSGLSDLLSGGVANSMVTPILFEYARYISQNVSGIDSFGTNFRNPTELFRSIYEYFASQATPITVQSRDITFGAASADAGNVGNLTLSRLTVDENNYALEACTAEKKVFRCQADDLTGTRTGAEVFEVTGEQAAYDNLLRASFGSGEAARTTVVVKHAGTGQGGSLLNNSSFSDFSDTADNKFTNWTSSSGNANLSQVSGGSAYTTEPGGDTAYALRMASSGTTLITQPLSSLRVRRLDADAPYFLRIMYYPGTGADGTLKLRLGSQEVTVTSSTWTVNQWQELTLPIDENVWTRNFNEADFSVDIEWTSPTSGTMTIDDAILAPWNLIDGTYYCLRHTGTSATPSRVDDGYHVTDSYTAGTGKIQYYCYLAGLGYLPSTTSTPVIADPT